MRHQRKRQKVVICVCNNIKEKSMKREIEREKEQLHLGDSFHREDIQSHKALPSHILKFSGLPQCL